GNRGQSSRHRRPCRRRRSPRHTVRRVRRCAWASTGVLEQHVPGLRLPGGLPFDRELVGGDIGEARAGEQRPARRVDGERARPSSDTRQGGASEQGERVLIGGGGAVERNEATGARVGAPRSVSWDLAGVVAGTRRDTSRASTSVTQL